MKKQLTLKIDAGTIKVTIQTNLSVGLLTRYEQSNLINQLAEGFVPVISKAHFVNVYNHQVKVS